VNRPLGTTFADLLGKLTVVRVECVSAASPVIALSTLAVDSRPW
jgi:hypothetical protein